MHANFGKKGRKRSAHQSGAFLPRVPPPSPSLIVLAPAFPPCSPRQRESVKRWLMAPPKAGSRLRKLGPEHISDHHVLLAEAQACGKHPDGTRVIPSVLATPEEQATYTKLAYRTVEGPGGRGGGCCPELASCCLHRSCCALGLRWCCAVLRCACQIVLDPPKAINAALPNAFAGPASTSFPSQPFALLTSLHPILCWAPPVQRRRSSAPRRRRAGWSSAWACARRC